MTQVIKGARKAAPCKGPVSAAINEIKHIQKALGSLTAHSAKVARHNAQQDDSINKVADTIEAFLAASGVHLDNKIATGGSNPNIKTLVVNGTDLSKQLAALTHDQTHSLLYFMLTKGDDHVAGLFQQYMDLTAVDRRMEQIRKQATSFATAIGNVEKDCYCENLDPLCPSCADPVCQDALYCHMCMRHVEWEEPDECECMWDRSNSLKLLREHYSEACEQYMGHAKWACSLLEAGRKPTAGRTGGSDSSSVHAAAQVAVALSHTCFGLDKSEATDEDSVYALPYAAQVRHSGTAHAHIHDSTCARHRHALCRGMLCAVACVHWYHMCPWHVRTGIALTALVCGMCPDALVSIMLCICNMIAWTVRVIMVLVCLAHITFSHTPYSHSLIAIYAHITLPDLSL